MINTGHTGQFSSFDSRKICSIVLSLAQLSFSNSDYIVKHIAPCSEDYIVAQLYFHWGHSTNNTDGSEHLLEGRAYPLEVFSLMMTKDSLTKDTFI